jgi:DNA repair protein RadD
VGDVITLRPYQERGANDIRRAFASGKRAPLYVAPTGAGKTKLFAHISHGAAAKGNRVLILSHRVELVDQISGALTESETPHGFIAAGYPSRDEQCMVASVQTLVRRFEAAPTPDLIIVDEAHHARAGTWETILRQWPTAKTIGVTATPMRASGEGLASVFDCLVLGPTVAELTPEYLAPARVWAPPTIDTSGLHTIAGEYVTREAEAAANRPSVTGDALAHYRQHADGKSALVFCVSVKHATDVAAQFREAGYSAVMLKGGMDRQLRRDAMRDFRDSRIQIVTSCDLFTEGLDAPGCHVGIVLRPTKSLALWRQMCGRILRPSPGKDYAILLDHAGNTAQWGRPIDEPAWALTYDQQKRKRKSPPPVKICSGCWSANSANAMVCANCGEPFKSSPRSSVEERDGELVEITAAQIAKRQARREQGRAQSLADLQEFARRKGYRPGWAERVYAARLAKRAARA